MRFISKLEWEGLQEKYEVKVLNSLDLLPPGAERIEIYRDDSYRINAKLTGKLFHINELEIWIDKWMKVDTEGYFLPVDLEVDDQVWFYKFNRCFFDSGSQFPISSNRNNLNQSLLDFEVNFYISNVVKKYKTSYSSQEIAWLTEWYLNGPKEDFYTRMTSRELAVEYTRNRLSFEETNFKFPDNQTTKLDYVVIQLDNLKFVIHDVPKYLAPNWSNCLGIEYREEWGGIPESGERESIAEIVGFIAGRQLFNIGLTEFDKSGYAIQEIAKNPPYSLGHNLITTCQSPDFPPVRLQEDFNIKTEEVLQQLIPNYLSLREPLHLKSALHRYWLSKELPIGDNLPTLAAGIETLSAKYCKYRSIELIGNYIPKGEFKEILKEELTSIENKLKIKPNGEKVLNKILGAYSYQLGVNGTLRNFFADIQLILGEIEEKAMKARNKMVHSQIDASDEAERREMSKLTSAYQTLFHRIMLRILGFEGKYIDYYSLDNLQRAIEQPIGGSSHKSQ
ncbi:hypothetical protein DP113_17605 [Brasilonema octagenarum UFV-E1]|uniref:ApeA N-terminal domain-containing protein n=2 Tax=Brasilonema TaxID=383614 RepID=A0A856MIK8_9CYAN|nr:MULTISPECIES: hypothetical protein [Brasilonema]NMF65902.1 hypothetical protein [Brasilonema octagenarum UFV-OR1]QDL09481.1 hypothetical protein DP114_17670 [Brasilonema sennae CENA114]QDL15837.1 hypothetical protein DP113_17605 [Brasilonema octagenarum UFV-E1]